MSNPIALITGVTGQDGSYLIDHLINNLIDKGYQVHGIKRHSSNINTPRIDRFLKNNKNQFHLHHGDITDMGSVCRILQKIRPTEIYNLAAMSHVAVSFDEPIYTAQVNALGCLHILEAMRIVGIDQTCRFYQASTSELYGKIQQPIQDEKTPFYPRSPYATSKQFAYWSVVNYREAYNMFACNGILFNHESPVRGETFITRKITRGIAALLHGHIDCIYVGNLDAKRDWGHAADYVEAMHLMLQQDKPEDFVIATGITTTVRDMIILAFAAAGQRIDFNFPDKQNTDPLKEVGYLIAENPPSTGYMDRKPVIKVDPKYFRPAEVDVLIGDSSKAYDKLGWQPKHTLQQTIAEMVHADMAYISKYGYNG